MDLKIGKLTAKAEEYKYLYRFNCIPFDTKTNTIVGGYKWKEYYKNGVLDDKIQKQWTLLESFDKGGIAIILGRARERDGFDDTNVFAIDLDGESAVKAFCTREDGSVTTLEELSKQFIVEWHDKDPTSIHIIGYSKKKLKNCKLITKASPDKELREAIEVKADSLLINMSPSLHKSGGQWTRLGLGEEKIPDDDRKGLIETHLINIFKRYGVDYTTLKSDYDTTSREQENRVLSVIEMKQVKKGLVKGFGRIVAISEQYEAVSRIDAVCNGMVRCACDASEDEHERPCGYKLHIDYTVEGSRPPTPIIISAFDIGDGKPQICPKCKQPDNIQVSMDYRRAKLIQLQDIDNRTDNARQEVILYDNMVDNLKYNEIVQVEGKMVVERRPGSPKTSMMDNRLHAISVEYLKPKDVVITEADIKTFYRWKEICIKAQAKEIEAVERFKEQAKQYDCVACQQLARKIIPMSLVDRQAAAKAPNIIGHLPARAGLLRTIVGGTNRGPGRLKGKINTLLIGDKGTAKSSIGEEGLKIHPNSGKVTATHATGKAVTGIVDKDAKMLVLGILPASDFVLLDEIDKLPPDEQSRLLGILEENHFSKDAYALHYEIDTDVAIVATANPTNTDWIDEQRVSQNEIGLIPTLKDRFTQIFTFRDDLKTREKRLEFAKKFAAIRMKPPPNYTFFRKLWIFESGLKPEITSDADKILYEFWAKQEAGAVALMDTRFLRDIYKIAEAEAKLNLSEEVTEQIADETQQAMMVMLVQYGEEIKKIVLPSEITYNVCLEIIKYTKVGISVDELTELAKREEIQVSSYLGNMSKMQDSKKIQKLVSRLIRHPNVKVIQEKPKVLQWTEDIGLSGAYGAYDTKKKISSESDETNKTNSIGNKVD